MAELPAMLDLIGPDGAPAAAPEHLEGAVLAGFAATRPAPARRRRRVWLPGRAALVGALAGAAATVAVLAVAGVFEAAGRPCGWRARTGRARRPVPR